MDISAVIIFALFAQAGGNPQNLQGVPQNPQATATRIWLDNQTGAQTHESAAPRWVPLETAASRAAAQKWELRSRWQDFAREANACAIDTDAPDRRACNRAAKAWRRVMKSAAWPADYGTHKETK
jgi:hypothetical protein